MAGLRAGRGPRLGRLPWPRSTACVRSRRRPTSRRLSRCAPSPRSAGMPRIRWPRRPCRSRRLHALRAGLPRLERQRRGDDARLRRRAAARGARAGYARRGWCARSGSAWPTPILTSPRRCHELRKSAKKWRYAIEYFESLYGGEAERYYKRCSALSEATRRVERPCHAAAAHGGADGRSPRPRAGAGRGRQPQPAAARPRGRASWASRWRRWSGKAFW